MNTPSITAQNTERNAALRAAARAYDPIVGAASCGTRLKVPTPLPGLPHAFVPATMVTDPLYRSATSPQAWQQLRCAHDFEYWCATAVRIKPKDGYTLTPFILNRAQRKVLAALEDQRLAAKPIRLIILKARQWGCSTLIQNYMAWIQMCIRPNWNSLICCHNKDSAVNIRRLYSDLIRSYPAALWDPETEGSRLQFRPFEGSSNVREITGRSCRVAVTSSESQDAIRGYDIAMAHLSETAFWRDTPTQSPSDLIRSVCGSVALLPYTLVVMESTANGIANYFHDEWQRATAGESDKTPIFIPWFDADINTLPLTTAPEEFFATLTIPEQNLWNLGCTLEQINWYRQKARIDRSIQRLQAEYPSTPQEAFGATNCGVFHPADIQRLAQSTRPPLRTCRVAAGRLFNQPGAELEIWQEPHPNAEYVAAVDIGGRSAASDWSVIAVMRRADDTSPRHQIVAQWRGHTDHDCLVQIAATIARRYNDALLVIESNTLETEANAGAGANSFVLQGLAESYPNLYRRRSPSDNPTSPGPWRIGFHTNRATKVLLIGGLIKALRDNDYTEPSQLAIAEYAVYTQLPNGAYAAKPGAHDDIIITRALALQAITETTSTLTAPSPCAINPRLW